MAESLQIRRGQAHDAPLIAAFNAAMALETEGKVLDPDVVARGVAGLLEVPARGLYLVAQEGDEVVGALMITYEWSDWRDGLFWWIQSVYVRPEARRRGVFRALYAYVRALASDTAGVCGLRLYVESENANAQRTYEALGMHATSYHLYEESF